MVEGVIYGAAVLIAVFLLAWMLRQKRTLLERVPNLLGVAVLCLVLGAPWL
jgi:hypothetical protein